MLELTMYLCQCLNSSLPGNKAEELAPKVICPAAAHFMLLYRYGSAEIFSPLFVDNSTLLKQEELWTF
jgi:hypothetical protein